MSITFRRFEFCNTRFSEALCGSNCGSKCTDIYSNEQQSHE